MADFLELARADLARKGRIKEIAAKTGIKEKTLRNFRYGVTKGFHSDNYEKLRVEYLREVA
jgi:hypothetical protein